MRATYQVGMATLREGVADRRAMQREADAQQEVEAALAQLSNIDQQAKQEQQAAQAAIQTAEAQVAAARVASAQAQADLALAQEARANALVEQARARYEAALVRRVTNLERAGVTAAQTFRFRETETLLAAFKATNEVNTILKTEGLAYLAYNPLLVLQTSLNQIRETRLTGHQGSVGQVVFSPDGSQIATSGADGTARLWDLAGNQVALMEGHQGTVLQVTFSPDGQQIATIGADGTSRIWALNGQQIAQYEGDGTLRDDWQYIAVRLQPDRLRGNGVVKLWPVYTLDRIDELLAAACQRLTPYLTHNPDISNEDRALCGIPPRRDE